ncbi:MAG: hypothetical protein HRU03_05465 [Nanoarchaeales archaeon]|nr:hypothetical protein [Nanoarchaeales archaeon]
MREKLKHLGLNNNEIEIYLLLLKQNNLTGQQIRKISNIANSRVYSCLDSLISKGIVTYQITPKHKIFSALPPSTLVDIAESRKREIESIIPELKELESNSSIKTKSAVYEGLSGFKTAFYNMANLCSENETISIIGFSNQAYKNEKLKYILKNVNKISIKKKHKFKMILDSDNNMFAKDRTQEKITELRFMPKGFVSPAAIDIFEDKVYIFMWSENPYVFMIQNEEIAKGFKIYFNFLWNMGTKK